MKIELKDLTKVYEDEPRQVVFEDLNLSFDEGIHLLVGESGCGKSTLLSLLGLLDSPTSGAILFDGKEITKEEISSFRKNNISYFFQDTNLFLHEKVKFNLAIADKNEEKITSISKMLGIENLLDVETAKLSKGEMARVAIARVLLEDKPILILDEPTGNLDEDNCKIIYDALSSFKDKKQIFIASHQIEISEKYADTIHYFEHGEIKTTVLSKTKTAATNDEQPIKERSKTLSFKELLSLGFSLLKTNKFATIFSFILVLIFTFVEMTCIGFLDMDASSQYIHDLKNLGYTDAIVSALDDASTPHSRITVATAKDDEIMLAVSFNEGDESSLSLPSFIADELNISLNEQITLNISDVEITAIVSSIEAVNKEVVIQNTREYLQNNAITDEEMLAPFMPKLSTPYSPLLKQYLRETAYLIPLDSLSKDELQLSNFYHGFLDSSTQIYLNTTYNEFFLILLFIAIALELITTFIVAFQIKRSFMKDRILLNILSYSNINTFFTVLLYLAAVIFIPFVISAFIVYPSVLGVLNYGLQIVFYTSHILDIVCVSPYSLVLMLFILIVIAGFSFSRKVPDKKIIEELKKDKS